MARAAGSEDPGSVSQKTYSGALFDMDGTLLDIESLSCETIDKLLRKYALEMGDMERANSETALWTRPDHLGIVGKRAEHWTTDVLERTKFAHGKVEWQRVYQDWEDALDESYGKPGGAPLLPGVERVTRELQERLSSTASTASTSPKKRRLNTPEQQTPAMAIATSSNRHAALRKLTCSEANSTMFRRFCHQMITAEDVSQGKPNPEPFQKAAELVRRKPEECVAFEDSPFGCMSAKAAGCFVVAIPDMIMDAATREKTFPPEIADLVLSSLEDFDVQRFFG